MSCDPCITPAQATLAFFQGTRGPGGPPGPASVIPGPPGDTGAAGASAPYVGPFVSGTIYYCTAYRTDVVAYNGRFWVANNRNKSGLNTWSSPTFADWADYGATLVAVATKLMLQYAAEINVAFNFSSPGYLKSNNFVEFVSGWLLTGAGRLEAYDALIAGFISTNTPKFNLEDVNRTMPGVASAQFDIAPIVDGDIPVNPDINNVTDDALIFFGWNQGANTFLENRFGNTSQKFTINLSGLGENVSAGTDYFYIQVYYRTRNLGGAWGAWTVIGLDSYMQKLAGLSQTFDLTRDLTIALTGDDDIQFSAGFSKGAAGTVGVDGAQITVKAFN